MTRRVKKNRSFLAPLADNFIKKLSSTDVRLRRKYLRFGLWILLVMVGYSFMSGTYGIPRIIRLELEESALTGENRQLIAELIDAQREREMLRTDRNYIEYIARTKYFMSYPDETIYRYRGR